MAKQFAFEADDRTVEKVLFSDRRFRVPRYQRPYAWTIDQVSEFWTDLVGSAEPYFLGSLVFCTESQDEDGFHEIIDGQQRLLTITLFMAAIRDIGSALDTHFADLVQRQDIGLEDRSGGFAYRIEPGDSLRAFFRKHVQEPSSPMLDAQPTTSEETRLYQNYMVLHQAISKELDRHETHDAKVQQLKLLRSRVASLVIVDMVIEREEDAYEIFETTNARGVDLSVGDLLKNLIFKKIPAGPERDLAKDSWQDITSNVEQTGTELKKFIRYYWLSKHSQLPEKKLYRQIKSQTADWPGLLSDLREASQWFRILLEGDREDLEELKNPKRLLDSLFALRLMDVSQCYVFLMAIVRNYDKLGTDPAQVFELIENFTFQYAAVCKLPGNKVEKVYSKYAIELEKLCQDHTSKGHAGRVQALFARLKDELQMLRPSAQVFQESFATFSYRQSDKGRRLVKYALSRLDTHLRKTREHRIDFDNVNIEHLLPQTPDPAWQLTKKDVKAYVNLLGNLTLVDKRINSRVQNKLVSDKLPELEKSQLPITQALVAELKRLDSKWSETHIRARQARLGELAYQEIWTI